MTTKTELLNNGVVVATKTAAPFYSWDWTPATSGASSLTVKVWEDSIFIGESGAITGTVEAPAGANTAPTTTADSYSMNQDNVLTVAAPGVLANDTDAEGNTLTAILVTNGTNGVVSLSPDGSFTYTPNAGYTGSDSFTYKSNDGTVDGNTVTVTIQVNVVLQSLSVSSETLTLSDDYKMAGAQPANQLLTPTIIYKAGKTYFAYLTNNANSFGMVQYDENFGIRPPHLLAGTNAVFNTHDIPAFEFQGNRMFVLQENAHNLNPLAYHKAMLDNDSFMINSNVGTISNAALTYMTPYTYQDKKVIIGQTGDVHAGYAVNTLNDIETAWTDVRALVSLGTGEVERYQVGVDNKTLSTDIIIVSCGRNDVPVPPTWFRLNLFRLRVNAQNYLDIYSFDGVKLVTGTATPSGVDEIPSTILYDTGSNTTSTYVPVTSLDQSENFYAIHGDGAGNMLLNIWKPTEATPVQAIINFPDAPTLVLDVAQESACTALQAMSLTEIYSYWKVNNGTRTIIRQYKTVDQGVNWTFVQDIDFGISVGKMKLPNNYLDIGSDKNFMLVAGAVPTFYTENSSDAIEILLKRASFGSIQAETPANYWGTLPVITESDFNSTANASYFIESGKITNTGTTLNTLIDQSANAVNLTAEGSPVIDNGTTPTEMTFDGVDDGFNLSPTIMAAKQKNYIYFAVVDALGNSAIPITISNNTNTNSFILTQIDALTDGILKSNNRFDTVSIEVVGGDTIITAGYHVIAWMYGGSREDVRMWVDGRLQLRNVITTPTPSREGTYILPNGNTNISIGKMERTSTIYYNFKMKHISLHQLNSEAQILERTKFLANKYGITLLNAYR